MRSQLMNWSLRTRRAESEILTGLDCGLHEVFLLARSLFPEDLRLQEEEVADVVRLLLDDVEELCAGGEVTAEK